MADLKWLNHESLAKVLQKQIPAIKPENIFFYELKEIPQKGDHFSSNVVKIIVHFTAGITGVPKKVTLFTKTILNSAFGQVLKETGILGKEILMYASVLPELNTILRKDSVAPTPYSSPQEETIILEDLSVRGYKLVDRIKQLDYAQAVCVLKKLAKFHAASVVIQKKNPSLIEKVGENIDAKYPDKFATFHENALATVINRVEKWKEIENHMKYAKSLRNLKQSFRDSIHKARTSDPDIFKVLNHSDLWLTNILFKFDENNKIEDCKFIDYQLCLHASPVIDLHTFLAANVRFDIFENSQEELIIEYLNVLNLYLTKFKTGMALSYGDLKREYDKTQILSFYAGVILTIPVLADPQTAGNFSSASHEEMAEKSLYDTLIDSKYYRQVLPKMLKYYEKIGILS